ncbi:hypothetical protein FB567DRAFT_31364 [Paraphoma chrysanthemicola]|uniref:DUF676 domain-containing protein n=1 Tax=Paraphoma chrysanthemicola TaxID=798071 RepID=A0A8K0RI76_9PLEO|nr:hypothetical protein FB567DRAFT_31364 [Paraphoma chrysanthemicola]
MPLSKRLQKLFGKRASPSSERVQSSPYSASDTSFSKETKALRDDNKPEDAHPNQTLASHIQSDFVKRNSNRILDLKLVHQPAASNNTDVDIIFVHGLTGNAVNTWLHQRSGTYLPELLGQDIDNTRIFTFGYDADVASFWGGTSQNRLTNHAEKLLGCLAAERPDSVNEKRKILFVTHSLGGLVVKRAMQMSKSSAEAYIRNIESSTAAIAFLGTPHSGSDFAPFAKSVSRVLSLTGKRVNVNILDTLKRDSQVLLDLEDWFGHWLRRRSQDGSPIELTCFIEELELPIVGRVVEEHQAKISGYSSFGIHANHMDMTKFEGEQDPGYKLVRAQITRWVGQIQSQGTTHPANTTSSMT